MTRLLTLSLAFLTLACFKASDDVGEEAAASETLGESTESGGGSESPSTSDESPSTSDESPATGTETSGGPYCGNGEIEEGETCDAMNVGGMTCASFSHDSGEIICNTDCTLDIDGCYTCGDQKLDGIESCDGSNLGGQTCASLGFMDGPLACGSDCLIFDTGACVPFPNCGNGQFDQGLEDCEGDQLNGMTCEALGFSGGTLSCTAGCLFDTSACAHCGNGTLEPGEECDGFDFGADNCQNHGFTDGFLNCNENCTVDTTDCCIGINCQQW